MLYLEVALPRCRQVVTRLARVSPFLASFSKASISCCSASSQRPMRMLHTALPFKRRVCITTGVSLGVSTVIHHMAVPFGCFGVFHCTCVTSSYFLLSRNYQQHGSIVSLDGTCTSSHASGFEWRVRNPPMPLRPLCKWCMACNKYSGALEDFP